MKDCFDAMSSPIAMNEGFGLMFKESETTPRKRAAPLSVALEARGEFTGYWYENTMEYIAKRISYTSFNNQPKYKADHDQPKIPTARELFWSVVLVEASKRRKANAV